MLKVATERQKTLVDWRPEEALSAGEVCWLDLRDPTDEELQAAARLTGVPVSLLKTAADTRTSIQSDAESGWLLLVTRAIDCHDDTCRPQHLGLLASQRFLITIHEADLPETAEVSREWQLELTPGAPSLLYYLFDALLDRLFPMLDHIEDRLYETEEAVVSGKMQSMVLQNILLTGRQLLAIRKVGGALRETSNAVLRRTPQQEEQWSRFQEVYDHATRVVDISEMLHEVSSNSIEAHLATVSNQLNSVMKTLTIWATILMTVSLISGIFGMNFAFPGIIKAQSLRGFWIVMGAIGASVLGLLYLFRRMRYLG
jgi:magnesium transporter